MSVTPLKANFHLEISLTSSDFLPFLASFFIVLSVRPLSIPYKPPKCFPFSQTCTPLNTFLLPEKVHLFVGGRLYIDLFLDSSLSLIGQDCVSLFLTPLHECTVAVSGVLRTQRILIPPAQSGATFPSLPYPYTHLWLVGRCD